MGHCLNAEGMFRSVKYNTFTTTEVVNAMNKKLGFLEGKIRERNERIVGLMKSHNLTEQQVSELIIQHLRNKTMGRQRAMSYNSNSIVAASYESDFSGSGVSDERKENNRESDMMVPAGVVENINTEKELIDNEKDQVKRMKFVVRNIKQTERVSHPETGEWVVREAIHTLSDDEMDYLGF